MSDSGLAVVEGFIGVDGGVYFKLATASPDRSKQGTVSYLMDTGFGGSVALPLWLIAELVLPPFLGGKASYMSADGSTFSGDIYEALLEFGQKIYSVRVVALPDEAQALLGRRLINGCKLEAMMRAGGKVSLEVPLSKQENLDDDGEHLRP